MDQLLRVIAWVIETFAQIGAGLASSGAGYQPKVCTIIITCPTGGLL